MRATRDWFGDALASVGKTHKKVVVVNCDLASATKTQKFKDEYNDRFFECGIAEANGIGIAAGLAQEGMRPFLASFGHFLASKYLEIFQSIGLNNTGVVLVGTHAGLAIGKDGPTQMGLRDLALMRTLHNMEIYHPVDGIETQQMMEYLVSHNHPSYLRLCRQPVQEVHDKDYQFSFGEPDVLSYGTDITIFSMGGTIPVLVDCLETFQQKGISATIVNVSSLPISKEKVKQVLFDTKQVLVLEDHFIKGGLADEIGKIIMEIDSGIRFASWGVPDYGQAADPGDLYARYQLDANGIINNVEKFLSGQSIWQ